MAALVAAHTRETFGEVAALHEFQETFTAESNMKNSGIAIGLVAIGAGLVTIGLNMNGGGTAAHANAPMVQAGGPTIVWYGTQEGNILRAWSDGTIEQRWTGLTFNSSNPIPCYPNSNACATAWFVIASPTQGLAASADINFDQRVDGADMALLLGYWGDAPRSPVPPSDCPLAMINP